MPEPFDSKQLSHLDSEGTAPKASEIVDDRINEILPVEQRKVGKSKHNPSILPVNLTEEEKQQLRQQSKDAGKRFRELIAKKRFES